MKIVLDIRESGLIDACKSMCHNYSNVCIETAQLPLGDIIFKTEEEKEVLIIERKTYNDLLASIKDGRYEEQSHRLIHASGMPSHNIIYLIEGMLSQIDNKQRKLIYSIITSLNVFKGFSVWRSSSLQETADILLNAADKIDRDFIKGRIPAYLRVETKIIPSIEEIPVLPQETMANANSSSYSSVVKKVKKDNITAENIGEIILCQIPGISSKTACAIMKKTEGKFGLLIYELQQNPDYLQDIVLENGRKINRTVSGKIIELLGL